MKIRLADRARAARGWWALAGLGAIKQLSRLPGIGRLYPAAAIAAVKQTGLFDKGYYLEANADVAESGIPPLRHYVLFGDREGRMPMLLFDPVYYRAHVKGKLKSVNALLHYAWVGRYFRKSPSPWFDVAFYLSHNKDVARAGLDPLIHYLRYGGIKGLSPSANFDGAYYLRCNHDVVESGANPLLHYLGVGRLEGRPAMPGFLFETERESLGQISLATLPSAVDWASLRGDHSPASAVVDVVVPVYKGRAETLRCLYSVLASSNKTPYELVVIDDASPDAELVADLKRLAGEGFFTLLANPRNSGFVHTANRGMALHPDRDVVLLNSDTEVYGDWLDRLHQAATRRPRTGTVTPLSNNATICSYPRFLHDNPYPLEVGFATLDAMAATVNAGVEVDAPTGVGFCLYLRRECLDEVGLFDEEAFGRGYGEENDFCQRAIVKGWRNVIAADVFVRHWGSTSFQGERAKRVQAALKLLDRRHPAYQEDVRRFIQSDPLAGARRALDWMRLKAQAGADNVLIVCHGRGGGAERHVQEDTRELLAAGVGVFYMRPQRGQSSRVTISHPVCRALLNLSSFDLASADDLLSALRELGISRIHAHGLVDFVPDAADRIGALARDLGVPLWVDVHDYKVICPRINLIDRTGRYCGEPADEARCDACLASEGNDFGVRSIREWRSMHHRVLKGAERIMVPDEDVAARLSFYYPDLRYTVSPHEDVDSQPIEVRQPELAEDEPLRIVVIGAIGRMKGYDILLACSRDAKKRRLPLEFVLLGYSMDDGRLKQAGVSLTGRYLEPEAQEKLHALRPHVVWLPSVWPETYSYTLSLALKAGYPVFAFDLGAINSRLRRLGETEGLLAFQDSARPEVVNQAFLAYRQRNIVTTVRVIPKAGAVT